MMLNKINKNLILHCLGILLIFCIVLYSIEILNNKSNNKFSELVKTSDSLYFAIYLDGVFSSIVPAKESNYIFDEDMSYCTEGATPIWDNKNWNIKVNNLGNSETKCILNFVLKNESVITFDYNYLVNNEFGSYYDTSNFYSCCGTNNYFINIGTDISSKGINYTATRYSNFADEWDRGYYFKNKVTTPLTDGKEYTLMFDSLGSENFSAIIGSEQGGEKTYEITTKWTRHVYTFTVETSNELLMSFVVYDWGGNNQRTLNLRNIQIQNGDLTSYSKESVLSVNKEFGDNLENVEREDWTFLGWFTDPINGVQITSDTLVPKEDITYYAHWSYNA